MRTIETLKKEIKELLYDLAQNNVNLQKTKQMKRTWEMASLLCVRSEIYKSICFRQKLLIEQLEFEILPMKKGA